MEISPARGVPDYQCSQSKIQIAPKLPLRAVVYGSSGSGKTILLQQLILKVYRNCWARVFIFSPSVKIDAAWAPVLSYVSEHLSPREKFAFDEYDPEALAQIIEDQTRIATFMKGKTHKIPGICILIDDFGDDAAFSRRSTLLHKLFIRGRHAMISTIVSSQRPTLLSPIVRTQATDVFTFRLRNALDYQVLVDEISALVGKDVFQRMYRYATDQPHGFLYINLVAPSVDKMFYSQLMEQLVPR
jgi:Cdc6-like AAA superfamily ATPase